MLPKVSNYEYWRQCFIKDLNVWRREKEMKNCLRLGFGNAIPSLDDEIAFECFIE